MLKLKQIKEIAEIHVMCDMTWIPPPPSRAPPPPLTPATIPTATTLWDTFILTFFLGRKFICLHNTKDKWDMRIIEAHPKVFRHRDCSKLCKMTMLPHIVLNLGKKKVSQEGLYRDYWDKMFSICLNLHFLTMTVMTVKSR